MSKRAYKKQMRKLAKNAVKMGWTWYAVDTGQGIKYMLCAPKDWPQHDWAAEWVEVRPGHHVPHWLPRAVAAYLTKGK